MIKISFSIVLLSLAALFLRHVPIGNRAIGSPDKYGHTIGFPRYWIPRQFFFHGWPLPGGELSLASDPHFGKTNPLDASFDIGDGNIEFYYQGVDVNPFFRKELQSHRLLIVTPEEVFRYDFPKEKFVILSNSAGLIYLGNTNTSLVFFNTGTGGKQDDSIFLVPIPLKKDRQSADISRVDTEKWHDVISLVSNVEISGDQKAVFCKTRLKPVLDFWLSDLERKC
jgi:hypothetical protein